MRTSSRLVRPTETAEAQTLRTRRGHAATKRQVGLSLGLETERNPLLAGNLHTTRHPAPRSWPAGCGRRGTRS